MPNTFTTAGLCGAAAILLASSLLFPQPARAEDFPDGPGKSTLTKVCTSCHDLDPVLTMKYSRKQWQALVYAMQDNGADATAGEVDEIVDYLVKNFGKDNKVNVNKATAKDIEDGLDLTTKDAAAVVEYRAKNGDFKTLDDVKKVDGVDTKKLDAAKDRVVF